MFNAYKALLSLVSCWLPNPLNVTVSTAKKESTFGELGLKALEVFQQIVKKSKIFILYPAMPYI